MGIKIIYLTGEGLWRQKKGVIETEFPGSIKNKDEPQQHSLVPNPVFPDVITLYPAKSAKDGKIYPRPFLTWEEFTNFPTPQVVRESEKSLMVAFDNDSFPLGPNQITGEDEEVRHNARQASFQEAIHRGRFKAEQLDRMIPMMGIITFCGLSILLTITLVILFLTGTIGR